MSIPERNHNKELKKKAIELSYQRANIKEPANELGVDVQRIYKLRKSIGNISTARVNEINRLKKKLKDARLEIEILKTSRSHLFKERWETYLFIAENKTRFPIDKMCNVLKVSRSSYYNWIKGTISKRNAENLILLGEIKKIFNNSKQTYGSPRITIELERHGYKISRPKVARLMKQAGLKSRVKKKYRVTTDSEHKYPTAPNLVKRNFTPDRINKIWVSDITYIYTKQGWSYLTIIIDLFDRQVIGWSLSRTMQTINTIIPAWRMAIAKRKITVELIFHSDRGVQYACSQFTNILKNHPFVKQSMSRKANCWDNAVAESFFKTLKSELIYHYKYKTRYQAEIAIFEYIEIWYNRKRLHSSLGYVTPVEYEFNYYQALNAA